MPSTSSSPTTTSPFNRKQRSGDHYRYADCHRQHQDADGEFASVAAGLAPSAASGSTPTSLKTVQDRGHACRGRFEHRAVVADTAVQSRAVEVAIQTLEQVGEGVDAVRGAAREGSQGGELTRRRDLVHRAQATGCRRTRSCRRNCRWASWTSPARGLEPSVLSPLSLRALKPCRRVKSPARVTR